VIKVEDIAKRILKFLASLKLAVLVIVLLGIISGWGTIVESRFNAEIAQKTVYKSIWMYSVLGILVVNLIAVIIDRIPWKKRHFGFISVHIGIIILLLGSYITQQQGLDGSMALDVGQSNGYVTLPETDLNIYEMTESSDYKRLDSIEVDFFLKPPNKKKYKFETSDGPIEILDYMPFATRTVSVEESNKSWYRKTTGSFNRGKSPRPKILAR
jgi:cytochrome c biogenesis protein ResB